MDVGSSNIEVAIRWDHIQALTCWPDDCVQWNLPLQKMGQRRWLISSKQITAVGLQIAIDEQNLIATERKQLTQVHRQATFPDASFKIDDADTSHVLLFSTGRFT